MTYRRLRAFERVGRDGAATWAFTGRVRGDSLPVVPPDRGRGTWEQWDAAGHYLRQCSQGRTDPANPALGADKPAVSDGPVKVREPDQARVFLARCAQHRLGALFEIAILTGLRRGEITGLRWSDLDLAKRRIVIRRNRVSVRGQVIEQQTTKTRSGLRTVALSEFAVATLLAWQLRQAEEAEAAQEAWQTEGHVFTIEDGRALDPSYVTRLFQKLSKAGADELPPLSFHGLRHCAASLMLASGADIAVVSKLLGHASIAITADVYGHLVGTIAQKAVDGAANLIAHTVHTQHEVDA